MRLPSEQIREARERIGAAQLLSLLLFAYVFVVYLLPSNFEFYIYFIVALILLMLLLCFSVLIYFNYQSTNYGKPLIFFMYTIFVSACCLFLVISTGNASSPVRILILIPVLIISTSQGEKWGLFASVIFGLYLMISTLLLPNAFKDQLFESNFVLSAIMIIIGWLVGGTIDIEHASSIKIKASEERFRTLFNNAPLGISIIRGDNLIVVNQAYRDMFGFGGQCNPVSQCAIREAAGEDETIESIGAPFDEQPEPKIREIKCERKDGSQINLAVQSAKIELADGPATVRFFADITEEKKLNQEIIRLDRLNIAGQIAAGIAHEIRNPITIVRGYLQLLQNREEFTEYKKRFDVMIQEIDRANAIITEFLSVVKDAPVKFEKKNLNQILQAIIPLINADAVKAGKAVILEVAGDLEVIMDERQIRQLILNLARNGLDAMTEKGVLIIRTYQNDQEIVLVIEDQGEGIPPEVFAKLGTPFFTTKEKGTGLGLVNSFRIAERHHAKIRIETGAGGTTFKIVFKRVNNKNDKT